MDYLWSPWRYRYISNTAPASGCIFCKKAEQGNDALNLVLHRGEHTFILLNRYPYTSGHLMIAPYAHVPTLEQADEASAAEMMRFARLSEKHIRAVYKPDGLNIGMNIGASAGAGIAGHIHMHVLPRWTGDSNFMTTVGETRVLPEDLEATYERLRQAFTAS